MPLYGSTSAAPWAEIGRVSLTATAAQIEFTDIPQGYRHLKVFFNGRLATGAALVQGVFIRFNGDSGTNYDVNWLRGLNAAASAGQTNAASGVEFLCVDAGATAAQPSSMEATVFDYAGTTFRKAVRVQSSSWYGASANDYGEIRDGLWENTAAITALRLVPPVNFAIGTTAELYGIR